MKIDTIILIFFATLFSCGISAQKTSSPNESQTQILMGTQWSSAFYYYHNSYFFVTDTTGFSQDGQYFWSTPIDPALYNHSTDSIMYNDADHFRYSLIDSVLTIQYLSADHDTSNDYRIFYLQKRANSEIIFKSEYEYTYGRECLFRSVKADK